MIKSWCVLSFLTSCLLTSSFQKPSSVSIAPFWSRMTQSITKPLHRRLPLACIIKPLRQIVVCCPLRTSSNILLAACNDSGKSDLSFFQTVSVLNWLSILLPLMEAVMICLISLPFSSPSPACETCVWVARHSKKLSQSLMVDPFLWACPYQSQPCLLILSALCYFLGSGELIIVTEPGNHGTHGLLHATLHNFSYFWRLELTPCTTWKIAKSS